MAKRGRDVAERTENGPPSTAEHSALSVHRRDRPRVALRGGAAPTIAAPERDLWAAILSDAVAICLGRTSASLHEVVAALHWIEEDSSMFGGFAWCCDLLGLDDSAIGEGVKRGMTRLAPARRRWLATCPAGHGRLGSRNIAGQPRPFSAVLPLPWTL
jgi:hypothetical protein